MNNQRSSAWLINSGEAKRRASLLFGLMVSVLVVGLLASYQSSSAAPASQRSGTTARPAGTVSISKTASANSMHQGGGVQYTVTIHNGMSDVIHISSFRDEHTQSGGDISINPASPGWISCSDPGGGSNLSCSNGSIAAGQSQQISFSATAHTSAPVGDIATDLASMVFRLPSDDTDRTAFSNPVSVAIVAAPPPNTPAPPAPTNTSAPVPVAPTPVPPTAEPQPGGRSGNHGEPGGGGSGGRVEPTPTAVSAPAGTIFGVITRGAGPAANVPITLHLKSGNGDTQVAATSTDANGQYAFSGMPSTPAGAGYYVYFASNQAGDLASWFTYNASYTAGQLLKLPTFDIADLTLLNQAKGEVSGRVPFIINRRYASETYLLRFAPWNRPSVTTFDAGSLGNGTSFTLNTSALPPNRYQGLIKIVDTTAGYGFANNHFSLTVSGAIGITTAVPGSNGVLNLTLTSNTTRSVPGGSIIYGIAVANNSDAALTNVVVTFPLVEGQTLDIFNTKTTLGSIKGSGNTVVAAMPSLAPRQGANITIFVAISSSAGSVLTNRVLAIYDQSTTAVASNQVSVTVIGGSGRPGPAPATTPSGGSGGTGTGTGLPRTGGEFPLWLLLISIALVGVIVAVRYIRLRRAA